MICIVDRIEDNVIVLELDNGMCVDVPKKLLPDAKEGDVVKIAVDSELTEKRKEKLKARANRLWKD